MVAKKTTGSAGAVPEKPGEPAKGAVADEGAAKKAAAGKATAKGPGKKAAGKRAAAGSGADASRAGSAGKASQTAEGDGRSDGAPPKKAASAKRAAAGEKAAKKAAAAAQGAAEAAGQTGAKTVVAKKTAGRAAAAGKGAAAKPVPQARVAVVPGELAVRPGEDPWTPDEVADARAELESEILRLRSELAVSEESLAGLMRDSGDGAGDDEADTGTKNIAREHEMALAGVAHEMLEQTERALARLDAGTYGLCEVCGKPIGKARMQAFPRATLCVEDKQKQERRG
ncbi:TraR/DksA family transcriptional regulator [Streptomyces sp. NPDC050504]|uniref:TraR/DksA family transcriptional regulator n=1 Tax=Streptomyces sp. NPDC050504 TaxID=3365618 RepID=UPI0037A8AA7C